MLFGSPLYWRETHKQPRFLFFDSRLVIFIFLMIMHLRFWTLFLMLAGFGIVSFFERKGVSPDSILRFLRARIVGRKRTARGAHNERSVVDYGFETMSHIEAAKQMIEMRRQAEEKLSAKNAKKNAKSK
jgi:hypothetical protein